MEKLTIGNQIIQYKVQKGLVLSNQGNLKTSVTSKKDSDGYVTGVSSHSTHYQKLYLKDVAGQEFVVDLRNWDVPALEGHELVLIWVQTPYMQNYALVHNKTLNQTFRVNSTDHYFKQAAEGIAGCLVPFFAVVGGICIPYLVYDATKSESLAAFTFFIVIGLAVFVFMKISKDMDRVKKNGLLLRQKIEEIFNADKD